MTKRDTILAKYSDSISDSNQSLISDGTAEIFNEETASSTKVEFGIPNTLKILPI